MSNIIQLTGTSRHHHMSRKSELAFYTKQKEVLEARLQLVREQLNVTDKILRLIKQEHEIEIGKAPPPVL